MKPTHLENLTKALQCSDLLLSDISQAYKAACGDAPVLEIVLRDLLRDASAIKLRLAELEACLQTPD